MTHRRAVSIWAVAGIMAISLLWSLAGPVAATGLMGMAGGAVVGANLPERWRRRLIVPKLPVVG